MNVNSLLVAAGYIILRGWCENVDADSRKRECSSLHTKESWCSKNLKRKREASHGKACSKKDNRMILWFEVDDTGCGMYQHTYFLAYIMKNSKLCNYSFLGIDPNKWESVFESFEQADPSTTRL